MRKLIVTLTVALTIMLQATAQDRALSGKITDDKGSPIEGVSVTTPDGKLGTQTDAQGNYKITLPPGIKSLTFSAVDFESATKQVGNSTSLSFSLIRGDRSLAEVVVVGYGTQRRKEVTGNLSTVKGAALANRPVQSFEAALGGRAAGVQITVPNGVVNNPPVFRIRGANSISLNTYPLIVVDGVPTYALDQGQTSAPANPLASINPNDIESIDIAKDAAASAIYGSRAANGVVFVTTKKGRAGKAKVGYNGYVGFTQAYGLPDILDATQYVAFKNVALANLKANNPATTGQFIIPTGPDGKPVNTNWYDEVYRQGFSQGHNVNVSGGNEGTTYYLSGGYTKQEGILRGNDFERLNFLLNIDSRINKAITIGGKVAYSDEKNIIAGSSGSLPGEGFASAGAARLAFALPPNISPYNSDGTFNYASGTSIGSQGSLVNGANPYTFNNVTMLLNLNRSNNEVNHLQSNVYLQIKPVNWLTLRSTYGIDNMLIDNDIFFNPYHGDGFGTGIGPGGAATAAYSKDKTWLWTNTAQADFGVGNHSFNLLLGNEQQRRTTRGFGLNRRTLSDSAYTDVQAGFVTNNASNLLFGENYLYSTFGRLNYNYNKKYFLSGNVRKDEYSALGVKENTFWGASAGWEIAQEKFWADAGINIIFSGFKLRGSYGKVGNLSGIGNYAPYSTYGSGLYGGNATLSFNVIGNPNIQWETSTKTDIGATFGLFKDRLTFDFAVYKNNIDNLLLNVPQAPSAGVPGGVIFQNVGEMYNKGIELSVNASPIINSAITWNTSFNFSSNKNEVTALAPGLTEILTATSTLETINKTVVGKSAGYLWVVRTAGVDPATGRRIFLNAAGQKVYYQHGGTLPAGQFNWSNADGTQYVNKDGKAIAINQADDAVLYQNAQPKYYGGWDNTFSYKGFELNILFTYQFGSYIYYGSNAGLHDQRFWNNSVDVLNYWQKPGDITNIPKPVLNDNTSNGGIPIDVNVFKGDFVKMKTVQVGYNLQKSLLSKFNVSAARFYVSAQNVAIFSNYPGPDPEVSTNGNAATAPGVDRNTLANGRTITVGVNVSF
ncbi:MAG: SusC/RagA family TonB-linked outer membrane protein [Ferruginibacter sp.]